MPQIVVGILILVAAYYLIVYVIIPVVVAVLSVMFTVLWVMLGAGALCGLGCSGWNFVKALVKHIGVRANI